MGIFLPKPLGSGTIEKSALRKDSFFKKPYGHCALGDLALYLGDEFVEANRYLPFSSIVRAYKRIEIPAGMDPKMAFMGGGSYYLIVEYDEDQKKQYKFFREGPLDKLLTLLHDTHGVSTDAPYEAIGSFGKKEEDK